MKQRVLNAQHSTLNAKRYTLNARSGATLIEVLLGVLIFGMLALSVYRSFDALLAILATTRVKTAAANLGNERLEIIRNMPYHDIGTIGGIPPGTIEQFETHVKDTISFLIETSVRNTDDPFDGTIGGSPNDASPADYKLVELRLTCAACQQPETFVFTARFAPKSLETATTNGGLFVQVINASGQPVSGATVHVANVTVSPPIDITDTTDADGFLKIIDAPPANQSYSITATKSGYSSEGTYPASAQNPNPVKPDATVSNQQVTQVTLSIDLLSQMTVVSSTNTCAPIGPVNFSLTGAKLIGANPDVVKYSTNQTTGAGASVTIGGLEWDAYTLLISAAGYDLAGLIPLSPVTLLAAATQSVRAVLEPAAANALLVTVTDSATHLPLSGASVQLTKGAFDATEVTGRGFLAQTDWSEAASYESQDGNIETGAPAGTLTLAAGAAPGTYVPSGVITSSIFDTGSASTFFSFTSQPLTQPVDTGADSVKFHVATATTTDPVFWNYIGPDGTAGTFYTTTSTDVFTTNPEDRYLKYRAYLSTAVSTLTPSVSDIAFTFASQCVPPGQVLFSGLTSGTYTMTVDRPGYASFTDLVTINVPWREVTVPLNAAP